MPTLFTFVFMLLFLVVVFENNTYYSSATWH